MKLKSLFCPNCGASLEVEGGLITFFVNIRMDSLVLMNHPEMPELKVKVTTYKRDGSNVRGLARIYFGDSFIVNNVNILRGKESIFLAMPSYKTTGNNGRESERDTEC